MSLVKKRNILIVVMVLTYMVVWGQSCINGENSQKESDAVMTALEPIHGVNVETVDRISDEFGQLNQLIRKSAHILEYSVIGLEFGLFIYFLLLQKGLFRKGIAADKRFWIYQIDALMVGMFTAVMDETIQIFSGRGPLVSDIWVDLLGIAIGMVIIAVFMVIKAQKNENTKSDNN